MRTKWPPLRRLIAVGVGCQCGSALSQQRERIGAGGPV